MRYAKEAVGGKNACWCGSRSCAGLEGLLDGPSAPGAYREEGSDNHWNRKSGQALRTRRSGIRRTRIDELRSPSPRECAICWERRTHPIGTSWTRRWLSYLHDKLSGERTVGFRSKIISSRTFAETGSPLVRGGPVEDIFETSRPGRGLIRFG